MTGASVVALGLLLAAVTPAHAQMYKCVDERGMTHYSDKPAALQERCARLRQEHAMLASGIRIGKIAAQGERVYLDDATRDARLVQLKEELRGCP